MKETNQTDHNLLGHTFSSRPSSHHVRDDGRPVYAASSSFDRCFSSPVYRSTVVFLNGCNTCGWADGLVATPEDGRLPVEVRTPVPPHLGAVVRACV